MSQRTSHSSTLIKDFPLTSRSFRSAVLLPVVGSGDGPEVVSDTVGQGALRLARPPRRLRELAPRVLLVSLSAGPRSVRV